MPDQIYSNNSSNNNNNNNNNNNTNNALGTGSQGIFGAYQSTLAEHQHHHQQQEPHQHQQEPQQQQFPAAIPVSTTPTTQQKRQHSNSYMAGGAPKRSVTQPTSPAFNMALQANNTSTSLAVESGRATAGTTTPATQLFPPSQRLHSPSILPPLPPQQQHQLQEPPIQSGFSTPISPVPQLPLKNKKFSQTFVNSTFKSKTPDIPNSPSLSVSKPKYDTSSYLNDDRTDLNDFNDTNSLAYTQPTAQSQTMIPPQSSVAPSISQPHLQPQPVQALRQQQQQYPSNLPSSANPLNPQKTHVVLTKEANPESPSSTISDASNPVHDQQHQQPQQNAAQPSRLSEEEQALISKLQDTYKTIIRLENTLQRKCSALNLPHRLDMTELWEIYNVNIQLLNAYYDFLLYSLSSGRSGKQIVQVYRIPRRLWVYGIVTFLDVLKNVVSIFIEHDICSNFIGYAFNILSGLYDLELEGWLSEKLGDISRMAIALYASRFIDWKISSEYWYTKAMKTQYGFGKIYYHIATVQQDNLDALVNIGKSVFCRDTFVPTPQYMRMVIDNINQRSYVDLPVLDFIKVHKVLLAGDITNELELNKLITFYSQNTGFDSQRVDFFVRDIGSINESIISPDYNHDNDYENKFQFWFQRSSSFALVNICQLIGFGSSSNPFARLFGLLEALRERKERKDKKDKRKKSFSSVSGTEQEQGNNVELSDQLSSEPIGELSVEDWFHTNNELNKSAIKLGMKMFGLYLKGPIIAGTPHVITCLYFIVAIGVSLKSNPTARPFIETLLHTMLPLNLLIDYLNEILDYIRKGKPEFFQRLYKYQQENPQFAEGKFIDYFNRHENLIEVWKCWGTLWFDTIQIKEEYDDFRQAGVIKDDMLDVPIGGPRYDKDLNTDRFLRILLLACHISDNYNFGLKRATNMKFGFHVEEVSRDLTEECSREFVKNYYLQMIREAKSIDLFEGISIDKDSPNPDTSNIFIWLKGNSTFDDIPTMGSQQFVNYTDGDADYEDEDEEEDDDVEGEEEDDDIEEDYNEGGIAGDSKNGFENEISTDFEQNTSLRQDATVSVQDSGLTIDKTYTFFILDTNMWLKHCGKLFKCVRSRVFKLAVPLVVFQELRSLRSSPDGSISDAATRAVITLRQLASEGLLIPLKMDGTETSSLNDIKDFEHNSSWMHSIDNSIINSSRLFSSLLQNMSDQTKTTMNGVIFTVLITEDRNMRLKSRTKEVPAFQGKWFFQILERLANGKCND